MTMMTNTINVRREEMKMKAGNITIVIILLMTFFLFSKNFYFIVAPAVGKLQMNLFVTYFGRSPGKRSHSATKLLRYDALGKVDAQLLSSCEVEAGVVCRNEVMTVIASLRWS